MSFPARVSRKLRHYFLARKGNLRGSAALILQDWSGCAPASSRLCIYAHYSTDGSVASWILTALDGLRNEGFDLVFVTSAEGLRPEALEALRARCTRILVRENVSLDFASWKCAIDRLSPSQLATTSQVLLLNDSVYGPFGPLRPLFEEMSGRNLDVWGLTESPEIASHVQSYFLVFERSALQGGLFTDFWKGFRFQWRKYPLIRAGEIGLSQFALDRGARIGAWIATDRLPDSRNPTLFHWELLIREFGFPFLKTELPRLNRFADPRIAEWKSVVQGRFPGYPVSKL